MDEITRQEYLSNMGIQSYFPRYILPAAEESIQCEWPKIVSHDEKDIVKLKIPLRQELLPTSTPIPKNTQQTAITAERIKGTKPDKAAEIEEVRFQLVIIHVNEDSLVLISRPYMHASNSLSAVQKQLFINIFNALYNDPVNLNLEIKPFRWPFSEASHIEKDGQAAKASLGAYLDQLKAKFTFNRLILMGEKIAQFVDASDKHELTVCRSLDEMLKMPQFKREVWLQLKKNL
ncbi:hypothetical protein N8303_07280 [Gammaproteobacteria bacterium]|jgi:hypothetical protein|nr:hypothetical protein [Gammaproteobacteria bacterium]